VLRRSLSIRFNTLQNELGGVRDGRKYHSPWVRCTLYRNDDERNDGCSRKRCIHSGTAMEGFADAVIDAVKKENVVVVNATENIDFISGQEEKSSEEESAEEHEGESEEEHAEHSEELDIDPHVWLDPIRSITVAENIKNEMIKINPENTKAFEDNFNSLKQDLDMLDKEFKDMVANANINSFLVFHSAYGYWEEAYGLNQIGISGLSPTDEPSQGEIIEIIKLVKEQKMGYIYFEPNLTNKVADAVKTATGSKALTLNNLESITAENIKNKEDYFSIMRENIEALAQGLK
jgi:zinc transport system substrate-binding protein